MKVAMFNAQEPVEVGRIDVEIMELLSRVRGALGWDVTAEGEVRVAYDDRRVSESTLDRALRGLGFERKPVPIPVPVRARYTYPLRPGRRSRR